LLSIIIIQYAVTLALHERAQQDQKIIRDGVLSLVDGLAQLQARTDTLARDQASRHKLDAASEAARELLEIPNGGRVV
jgi:hypothetical protein